jgi:phage gp36-like protein
MSYTIVDDVKVESGMSQNPYVKEEDVQDKIDDAEAIINSYLHGKYTLPFTQYPDAPPLIENIARKLASAYLLQMEYGPMNPGDAKDGFGKEKTVMSTIEKIQKGVVTLCDKNGNSLLNSNNLKTSFLPNDASSNTDTGDQTPIPGVPQGGGGPNGGPRVKLEKTW